LIFSLPGIDFFVRSIYISKYAQKREKLHIA